MVIGERARTVTETTLYTRVGDLFAYVAVLTTLAMLIVRFQISELRFKIGERCSRPSPILNLNI